METTTIESLIGVIVLLGAPLGSWIVIKVNIAEMKKDIAHNDDKVQARFVHVEEDIVELKTGRVDDAKERKETSDKFMAEVLRISAWVHELRGDIKYIKEHLGR